MLQAAASWLITVLPLVDFGCGPSEITRAGNEHRKFIPTNVYPARDGFVFMAIGSDVQWRRFTAIPKFACVANEVRKTNEGRHAEREAIHRDIGAVTAQHTADEILADLRGATIPGTRILDIRQVRDLPALSDRLTRTRDARRPRVHMQPMAVDLPQARASSPSRRNTDSTRARVLAEAGLRRRRGAVALSATASWPEVPTSQPEVPSSRPRRRLRCQQQKETQ